MKTILYSIEWLVPAKNAIGGEAYWDTLYFDQQGSRRTSDKQIAETAFETFKELYPEDSLRLCQTTVEVIKIHQPETK